MKKVNKQNKPFHLFVPQWMIRLVEQKQCSRCNNPVQRDHIHAAGVRELKKGVGFTFFVEHSCPKCDYAVSTNFTHEKTGDLEDLCYNMIEQMHRNKQVQKSIEIESGKKAESIQDSEVDECLKFLKNSDTYEDFLKFIGADNIIPDLDED